MYERVPFNLEKVSTLMISQRDTSHAFLSTLQTSLCVANGITKTAAKARYVVAETA